MIKITYGIGRTVKSHMQAASMARVLLTDNPHNWVRLQNGNDGEDYHRIMHTHPDNTIHTFSEGRRKDVDADLHAMETNDRHDSVPEDRV
jgi:hypothetical protein